MFFFSTDQVENLWTFGKFRLQVENLDQILVLRGGPWAAMVDKGRFVELLKAKNETGKVTQVGWKMA